MKNFFYTLCLMLITQIGMAQTALAPGAVVGGTLDEGAYGFILCETTGFGDNDATKTYSYTATSDIPCSNITVSNLSHQYLGVFVYEDNLPTSSTDPCIGSETNTTSTADLEADFNMISGKTYYFIVTDYNEPGTHTFDIQLNLGTVLASNAVVMNHISDGTTIELADGDTAPFYDSGGPGCDYVQGEDYMITVCPDAAAATADKIVQLEFTNFDINNTCELTTSLHLYRGTGTDPSNEIAVDGKLLNQDFNFDVRKYTAITTGGCMTITFENLVETNCEGIGWEANFSLLDNPCTITATSDECASAPQLEMGATLNATTECFTGSLSTCGFGFQNDGWFKVVADGTTMMMDYAITGGNACYDGDGGTTDETPNDTEGAGVQLIMYETCSGLDVDALCADKLITGGIDATNGVYASGTWTVNNLTDGATYYVQFGGLATNFCDFNISAVSGIALPIDLISFKAFEQELSNLIEWKTASEVNTDIHIIERSSDGRHYTEIGRVDAAGHSLNTLTYSFDDKNPLPEAYYRIKSFDLDLTFGYSSTVFVKRNTKGISVQSIYPNPTIGSVEVKLNAETKEDITLNLRTITGQLVQASTLNLVEGQQVIDLDLNDVPAGVYFVQLIGQNYNSIHKIIKE